MDNEKLIELVREYTFLYDLSDKRHSDNQKKDQAWNEIGIKLNSNGKQCKKAWALLRDAFRRSIKKRRDTSGQGPEKKWKHLEALSFLLPYMKERPICCQCACACTTTPALAYDEDDNKAFAVEQVAHLFDGKQSTGTLSSPDGSQQPARTLLNTSTQTQSKGIKKEKKRKAETPRTVLMKYILDSNKNTPDDISQFLAGISTTLRSFPTRDRAFAKAKIFEVVSQMEIEILSRPSTSNSVAASILP